MTDERIEAAALAMAANEGDVAADAKVRGLTTYRDFAREALAAADAVEESALAATRSALRQLLEAARDVTVELTKFGDNIPELHNANLFIAAAERVLVSDVSKEQT